MNTEQTKSLIYNLVCHHFGDIDYHLDFFQGPSGYSIHVVHDETLLAVFSYLFQDDSRPVSYDFLLVTPLLHASLAKGKVTLCFEGTPESYEKMKSLVDSGQLFKGYSVSIESVTN
jgi:hypothetical protein